MPAALGLVDLGVLLGLAFMIALLWVYRYTFGALIVGLAQLIGSVRLPGIVGGGRIFGFAADALTKLDNSIRHSLGVGIDAMQATWNECISYTATAVHWIGKEIASISHDTAQAIEGLHVAQIPKWLNRRLAATVAAVAALKARVLALEKSAVTHVEKITQVVTHKVTVVERAISVPDIGALPRAIPTIKELERAGEAALTRVKEYARRFGPAALLGTIVAAVARLGFGWVRCSKVGRTGKQLCGMNNDLLESLLADTLLIAGTVSLVEFAEGMQGITAEVTPLIRDFWRAT